MTGKELFCIWASSEHERWTRFAKPSLFVNIGGYPGVLEKPTIPLEIFRHRNDGTAFILDLPGANGVESGLALAELGFVPVPMYNGINESSIGGLEEVVHNGEITDALLAGSEMLKNYKFGSDALPVFLLDFNRNKQADSIHMYDNRWNIEPDDMPDALYLKNHGVNRVAVWTKGEIGEDLLPILESYRAYGIEISTFCDTKIMRRENQPEMGIGLGSSDSVEQRELKKNITKFENARAALLLILIMAFVNIIWMFLGPEEPILWTTPCIKWLMYLWVPEIVGDMIAIMTILVYGALYLLSHTKRGLMIVALALHGIDTAVLFIYAFTYEHGGIIGYADFDDPISDLIYILIILGFPVFCLYFMGKGVYANEQLHGISEHEYNSSLNSLDTEHGATTTRKHFRGFRGYGGYGGSGFGGYGGRGYYGGYRGGFGG